MDHSTPTAPELSIILPCFNEVDNVEQMTKELAEAIAQTGRTAEIIYVDDCSTDGSAERLQDLAQAQPMVRVVRHRINCGESAALLTGYRAARGAICVTMDADLQNDPADLPALLAKLDEGYDAVCGVRARRDDSLSKRLSSKIANAVRGFILGDGVQDAGCTYRVIRRECLEEIPAFKATHRFITTVLIWQGWRVCQTPINHRPRTRGKSKYGIGNRLWVGIRDMFAMRWYRGRMIPARRLADAD